MVRGFFLAPAVRVPYGDIMTLRSAAALAALLLSASAVQAQDVWTALVSGKPSADLRLRYETLTDKSRALLGDGATFRGRLGYDTARWNGLGLAVAFDFLVPVGAANYNTTRNGKTQYPQIGDTPLAALKHLNLSYVSTDLGTTMIAGRQRLSLGSQRFLASPDWRMHGQSFDAVQLVNTSVPGLTLTYIWIDRVNRIYAETSPFDPTAAAAGASQAGHFRSDSHVLGAAYTGIKGLRLEAYSLLVDLASPDAARTAAQRNAIALLSSATTGMRAEYTLPLDTGLSARLVGDYARQTDYAANPLSYGLDYWLTEASVTWGGLTGTLGYEVLGGNGTIGVSTPIGQIHVPNGWADFFSSTPANGLTDLYVSSVYAWPGVLGLRAVNTTLAYHDFHSARLDRGIGTEWNAQAEFVLDANVSIIAKYADYAGSGLTVGGVPDKRIFWLQTTFRY
jgi:hypothetical protein